MRTPKSVIAWCRDCKMGSEYESEIGTRCWNDCPRTLIKRVGYLCEYPLFGPTAPCHMIHWTVKSMKECQHDAY